MDPRRLSRGDDDDGLGRRHGATQLQWIRGVSAAVTTESEATFSARTKLQWIRGVSAAVTSANMSMDAFCITLQWIRGVSAAVTSV